LTTYFSWEFHLICQVCEKAKSKPRRIFDAVHRLWKSEAKRQEERQQGQRTLERKKKPSRAEDGYKPCQFCERKFCDNAFDRHVEFCRAKTTRLQASPPRDEPALAKLQARTKYNAQEIAKSKFSITSNYTVYRQAAAGRAGLPPASSPPARHTPR
jgi:hypothetical protein